MSRTVSGPRFVFWFVLFIGVSGLFLILLFKLGPKGRFTDDTLAEPLEIPGVARVSCIDPALVGPKDLLERQRCRNTDRLEIVLNLTGDAARQVAWVMIGGDGADSSVGTPTKATWMGPVNLKGRKPGPYQLVFATSDRDIDAARLQASVQVPGGNAEKLLGLEGFAKAELEAGAMFRMKRMAFQLEPTLEQPPAPVP